LSFETVIFSQNHPLILNVTTKFRKQQTSLHGAGSHPGTFS
jgi:hypothetical protein